MKLQGNFVTVNLTDIYIIEILASKNNYHIGETETGTIFIFHTKDIEGVVKYHNV